MGGNTKTPANILVVEDEQDLRDIILYNLEREGYQVTGVESGEHGLELAVAEKPDLILLDLMLPGMGGLDVCREIKAQPETRQIPIIMVSAKGEESDIVTGLELGADDYVAKPFSPRVLMARVRAALRRITPEQAEDDSTLKIEGLSINPRKFRLKVDGEKVELTKSEFNILHFLASNRGWVYTRYQIVNAIRGDKYVVTERAIDVQIAGLRKKLGTYSGLIETVRGIGYRFRE